MGTENEHYSEDENDRRTRVRMIVGEKGEPRLRMRVRMKMAVRMIMV